MGFESSASDVAISHSFVIVVIVRFYLDPSKHGVKQDWIQDQQ